MVRAIRRALPGADMVYTGDTCHVPYGEKPFSEILEYSRGISAFLAGKDIDALVIACNVSSAVACGYLRETYPGMPVISMIECGAALCGGSGSVGVLATEGTVKSGAYPAALSAAGFRGAVAQEACPEFVPIVEGNLLGTAFCREACRRHCQKVAGADTVILGCTHYPLMLEAIREFLPKSRIADPAEEAARRLLEIGAEGGGRLEAYTTGDREQFEKTASLFVPGIKARRLVWKEGRLEEDN